MGKLAYVTLLYVSTAVKDFPVREIMAGTRAITPDDYLPVTRLPLAELTSAEPGGAMEELLAMTASADWKLKLRRSLGRGDIMMYGNVPWMLVKSADLKSIPKDEVITRMCLIMHGHRTYAIVRIPDTQIKGDLCNQLVTI